MKYFAVAIAALAGAVAAQESCAAVTSTITVTLPAGAHTPSAPGSSAPTMAPYPTAPVAASSALPVGTGSPAVSSVVSVPGVAAPTGTGSYTTPATPEFTGAANAVKVGGMLAGVGAVAAFFL